MVFILCVSLTYDDASWSSVHLHRLGVDPFAVARLSYHLIGPLVALHAGVVQTRREASAARSLKFLVVFGLMERTERCQETRWDQEFPHRHTHTAEGAFGQ